VSCIDTQFKENSSILINTRYGEHNQLKVIGPDLSKKYEFKRYLVECNICKKDSEMFGNGIFSITKNKLLSNKIPCGCSRTPRYTQNQWEILVKRACKEQDYTYIDKLSDRFSALTKLHLRNNKNGFEWKTTKIAHLMKGHGNGRKGGFSRELPATLYLLKLHGEEYSFAGFGVTNHFPSRWHQHRVKLNKAGFSLGEYSLFRMDGWKAWEIEQSIRKTFTLFPQDIAGFKREATQASMYQELISFIKMKITEYGFNNHQSGTSHSQEPVESNLECHS
jgi:hypothetical protein